MNYTFIHIPKTAGTLVKTLIKISSKTPKISCLEPKNHKNSLGHFRVSEIKKSFPDKELKYFGIVRNPYDRVFSMWKFLRIGSKPHALLPKVEDNFLNFLISLKNNESDSRFLKSQSYFLDEDLEKIMVIKYEEKDKIINFLEENDVRWMDKEVNKTPGIYYKDAYVNDLSREIVKELYAEDFERFDYDIQL